MVDVHCHILPGVDDGVKSIEESREVLSNLKSFGIDKLVFTSHIKGHWGSLEEHLDLYKKVKPIADEYGIQTLLGHEVSWRNLSELGYEYANKLTFGKSKFFLLELSTASMPPNWQSIIYSLQGQGITVLIAHPERYLSIAKDISIAQELHNMGCYFVISANFVDRSWMHGKPRKTAKKLFKAGLVDIIASDAHCLEDYKYVEDAYKFASKQDWQEKFDFDTMF